MVTTQHDEPMACRGDGKGSASQEPQRPQGPLSASTSPVPPGAALPDGVPSFPGAFSPAPRTPDDALLASSGGGRLQLGDVLPRSVQDAQDQELQQQQLQQQREQDELQQQRQGPQPPATAARSLPPPGPLSAFPPPPAPVAPPQLQPQPQRPALPTPETIFSSAAPPPPPANPPTPSTTPTPAPVQPDSKMGPSWPHGSRAARGVARPARDAALAAAGREVELPLERALQVGWRMHAHARTRTRAHTHTHTHACMHARARLHKHTNTSMCTHTCFCARMHTRQWQTQGGQCPARQP